MSEQPEVQTEQGEALEQAQTRNRLAGRWAGLAWGVVISLFYVLALVNAVGNLIGMQQIADALDATISTSGWFWLVFGITLPVVVFVIALLLGRRRGAGLRVLILFAGLAAVSAFTLEIMHLVPQFSYFAV